MQLPPVFRSLLVRSVMGIVLPQFLILMAVIVGSALVYQRVVVSLLVDRDRQLALISASRVSQAMDEYAQVLESFLDETHQNDQPLSLETLHLMLPLESLVLFDAGIAVIDQRGQVVAGSPAGTRPVGGNVASTSYFQAVRTHKSTSISDILNDDKDGRDIILVAVPILDTQDNFSGALIGAIHIQGMPLSDLIKKLKVGDEGFAYLVDSHGRAVFHPDLQYLAADFSDRSYVSDVINGASGGGVEKLASGERLVVGFAPIERTGWGLIVREPWDEVIEPISTYRIVALSVAFIITLITTWLLWRAVGRINRPILQLSQQTKLLASGEMIESILESDIQELDALALAFGQMAHQITSYRAGLRRYLSAVTQSQEDERRRIARELHDETAQNILAIDRQLELLVTKVQDPELRNRLTQLQSMVAETVQGVRIISRNLRPLILEDLGLIPALQTMINTCDEENPTVHFTLEIIGRPFGLTSQQELALYRIAQEAITNSRKHANPSSVHVKLTFEATCVRIEVQDNGRGFEPPSTFEEYTLKGSYGLMGIQERAWAAGGALKIDSRPREGTLLIVSIPVSELPKQVGKGGNPH